MYLLSCEEQEEKRIMDSCKEYFSDSALRDVFVPTYDRMRRYRGAWHLEKKLIFPANVLLEIVNEDLLKEELNQIRDVFGKCLSVLKMDPEDEKMLWTLFGEKRHIEMSRGVIRNGVVLVTDGPLKGMESQICKIDRHKRLARLCSPKGRYVRYISAGLEIVEKSV